MLLLFRFLPLASVPSLLELFADLLFTSHTLVFEGLGPHGPSKVEFGEIQKTELCRVLYLTVYNNS